MSGLREFQLGFQRHVVAGDDGVLAALVGSDDAPAALRAGIYATAYRLRLAELLRNEFPAVAALLGGERFECLAADTIAAVPSTHRNLRWYGQGLPAFVRGSSVWSAVPALHDLARLDAALSQAFDAVDEPVATVDALAPLPFEAWPTLRLRFVASLQLQRHTSDAGALRLAHDRGEPPTAPKRLRPAVDWAVWRQNTVVRHRALDRDESRAARAFTAGLNVDAACDVLAAFHPDATVPQRLAELLKGWVAAGWVSRLEIPAEPPEYLP